MTQHVARAGRRIAMAGASLAASICAAWLATPSVGLAQPAGPRATIAPALQALLARPGPDSLTVWVRFEDKDAGGPEAMAARLAAAEAALAPRNRARRLRARVVPLVDAHDLPVDPAHLDRLRDQGLVPFAVSRWLNRAAVRVTRERVAALAALDGVAGLDLVARVRRSGSEMGADLVRPLGSASIEIAYGSTASALEQIGIPAVHDSGYAGNGVLVALLDDGYRYHDTHEALRDLVVAPGHTRDFVEGDTVVTDPLGLYHGTRVLGCLAGRRAGRYVGSAYGVDVALARTEDDSREVPAEMLYWGLGAEWADSLGADIVSSSVGYFDFDGTADDYRYADMDGRTTDVSRAARIAAAKGILVVTGVGNEGTTAWHYLVAPSDVHGDSVLAIGAVDAAGNPGSFSSYGPSADGRVKPDLAARGVSMPVLSVSGDPGAYSVVNGTSVATPLVAGLAACLMQARPHWTPQELIRALRETASRARNPDYRVGYGIPNGLRALRWPPPPFQPGGPFGIAHRGPNPFQLGVEQAELEAALGVARGTPLPARIDVHDALGRRVRTLWTGVLEPARVVSVSWDGRDDGGRLVAAGLYWAALRGAGEIRSTRIVALD